MEIQLYDRINDPISAIEKAGDWFAKSGMFKCNRVEQGRMLAYICALERKSPLQLLRENHVMDDGTLAPRSRNVHAKFLAEGGDIDWILTGDEQSDFEKMEAKATFKYKDKKPITLSFSIADARRQQLPVDKANGAWRKTPAKMLRARLITTCVDLFCPHIVLGVDEVEDTQTAPGPTITLESKPAQPTPAPVKVEQPIVEAQVVTEAKVEPAAQAPTESKPVEVVSIPKGAELPSELVGQLESAIGVDNAKKALAWLRAEGRLKPDQGLSNLTEPYARNIIKNTAKFIEVINKEKK